MPYINWTARGPGQPLSLAKHTPDSWEDFSGGNLKNTRRWETEFAMERVLNGAPPTTDTFGSLPPCQTPSSCSVEGPLTPAQAVGTLHSPLLRQAGLLAELQKVAKGSVRLQCCGRQPWQGCVCEPPSLWALLPAAPTPSARSVIGSSGWWLRPA